MYSSRLMHASRSIWRNARNVALVAASVSLAFAASCGSKKKKRSSTKATAEQKADRYGGNLRLQSNEPQYLNPVLETRVESVNMHIFEGLVALDARLQPVKRLAENWELSDGGKTITFRLRKGVKWHDGQPFTARDVKFTFDAIRTVEAPTLWKAYMDPVSTLETPDDHTVVVTYAQPFALGLLAWTVGILPKHVYGEGKLTESPGNTEPVGTGPYKLARWEKGERLILQANKEWWYGAPYIETVEVLVNVPDAQILDKLRKNELDFVQVPDARSWNQDVQLPEFRENFEATQVVEARFQAIAWNVQRKIFDDKRVRVALTYALNRGRVIDDVLFGEAQPISGPFFPNMFGADPSVPPYRFDLDAATKLLDEAGYKATGGQRFAITLIAAESARGHTTDETLAIFRHDLAAIGIELKVEFLPTATWTDRVVMRDFDAAYFGWVPDIPDPDPYALLHSSQIRFGSIHSGYANPEIDRLLDEARAATNRDERKALYHKVHAIFHAEVPYTMLYADYAHYAWSRRLRGVHPHDVGQPPRFPGLTRWWIDSGAAGKPTPAN